MGRVWFTRPAIPRKDFQMTYRQAVKNWRAAVRHVEWCARKSSEGSRVCTEALPQAKRDMVMAHLRMQAAKGK